MGNNGVVKEGAECGEADDGAGTSVFDEAEVVGEGTTEEGEGGLERWGEIGDCRVTTPEFELE